MALAILTCGAAVLACAASGCGTDDGSAFGNPPGPDTGVPTDDEGGTFVTSDASDAGGDAGCATGRSCGDGGVCAGDVCCAANLACGDVCCGGTQVCSFQKCVVPGAVCHDSSDCAANEYCELSLGSATDGGVADGGDAACVASVDRTGRCLPRPPECTSDAGAPTDGGALTCLEKCEYRPMTPTFAPVQKFAWGGHTTSPFDTDVMMAPIVIELDDDDCDGKVTERDIPEIVFTTFANGAYHGNGTLHAISIVGGAFVEKWTVPSAGGAFVVDAAKQIAGGNFDGKPGNEVVACGNDGKAHAFNGVDGSPLWTSPTVVCLMPSIADLDGDGNVEVIVEGGILDGADGTLKHAFTPALNGPFVISDLDSDGQLDVVTSARGYHADGTMFVDTGTAESANFADTSDWKGPWAAVGDFDLDGKPEVFAVDDMLHQVLVWRYDALAAQKFTIVRAAFDMNAMFATNTCPAGSWGSTHGGGPPTIADFDKDGVPDVALAGGIGYVVFNGKKLVDPMVTGPASILWANPTIDCSSASTGSTVFDFDGDGKAEVVYSDEHVLRIYEGATGKVLASFCNTTATLIEFPLVADVDNDGHADIVVISNAYGETCNDDAGTPTRQAGVRVFGDANGSWVRTRRVWNEHAYHITNVNEDGTIPKNELANWKQAGLNNFRQNKQPGSEFAAPNLVASLAGICPGPTGVTVTVRNVGEALVPAGVVVGVYAGAPPSGTKLGTIATTRVLYPAESEPLDFLFGGAAPSQVYAIIDDGAPAHPSWHECRTDDDTAGPITLACGVPH